MPTAIDRRTFFDIVRKKLFGGTLNAPQVQGMETIISCWERSYQHRTSLPQFAYCLATTKLETAHTMQPIKEHGNTAYFTRMYDINGARPAKARELGNVNPGDGAKFCGRGDVQITGRSNYRKATKRLRELKIIGPDTDFEKNPERVMQPDLACHIMFIGMEEGWFTSITLDRDIDDSIDGDEHADFIRARRIINGTDKAAMIAGYGDNFLAALTASKRTVATVGSPAAPEKPRPAITPQNGTAAVIVTVGLGTAAEAGRRGVSIGQILALFAVTAAVAAIAYIVIRHLRKQ